jgi:DNA-binding LacI/PurR family transcriptional regulator
VSADRRKQILDLAEKQRFSPNPGARMLRRGINSTLTVVVPLDESIFFSEFYGRFLAGALHAAAARGWDVQIRTLKRSPGTAFRETMQHIGMDTSGVIYLAEPLSSSEMAQLKGYRRPLVLTKAALPLEAKVVDLDIPVVGVDNAGGARSAISLLLQLGHRRIGLLLGPRESRDASERKAGYFETLRAAGVETRADWVIEAGFTADGGRTAMETMLSRAEQPTAVCCASDEIAFGAITAIQAAGRQCPVDFSVVGFDDGFWATMSRPALTTIRQPLADMAERAVAAIIEAASAQGKRHPPPSGDLPASLVIRDSTRVV